MSANYYTTSFQFISVDETRSAFDDSGCEDGFWVDRIIQQGAQIRKVETLLRKGDGDRDGSMAGFRWYGDDGKVLVAAGAIDSSDYRNNPWFELTTLTLNHNQRLVGVRSDSRGLKIAVHNSF